MKKLDPSTINWREIQKIHDKGVPLNKLGLSRTMYKLGIKEGLLKKNKRRWTEEQKKEISIRRKKWLKENTEKHVWKRNSKFVSAPCEFLKDFLKKSGISFVEEASVSEEKNYSVDILISEKNLIIEVNGNQHYDKYGNLKPYYKERHDHIVSLGWKIIEIHYTLAFNGELILNIINSEKIKSNILEFEIRPKKNTRKYKDQKEYFENIKKNWYEKNLKYVEILKNSGIDFTRFGWKTKVSKIINQKPQKVKYWMMRMMPDFLEEILQKPSA